jgi:hypothetical protein
MIEDEAHWQRLSGVMGRVLSLEAAKGKV